mmetsp:Transcript_34267/g.100809  ORF Transcript_34267/g.100809 Transcript_34267/m.100809 type:complete len:283 (-) Transcript_34267:150-998(-)
MATKAANTPARVTERRAFPTGWSPSSLALLMLLLEKVRLVSSSFLTGPGKPSTSTTVGLLFWLLVIPLPSFSRIRVSVMVMVVSSSSMVSKMMVSSVGGGRIALLSSPRSSLTDFGGTTATKGCSVADSSFSSVLEVISSTLSVGANRSASSSTSTVVTSALVSWSWSMLVSVSCVGVSCAVPSSGAISSEAPSSFSKASAASSAAFSEALAASSAALAASFSAFSFAFSASFVAFSQSLALSHPVSCASPMPFLSCWSSSLRILSLVVLTKEALPRRDVAL